MDQGSVGKAEARMVALGPEEPLLSVQGWRSRVPHQTSVVVQWGCAAKKSDQQRACCISTA